MVRTLTAEQDVVAVLTEHRVRARVRASTMSFPGPASTASLPEFAEDGVVAVAGVDQVVPGQGEDRVVPCLGLNLICCVSPEQLVRVVIADDRRRQRDGGSRCSHRHHGNDDQSHRLLSHPNPSLGSFVWP